MTKRIEPHLQVISSQTRFIIDRRQGIVRDTRDSSFVAEILQTQSTIVRDGKNNVVGVEVLHLCRTPNGEKFTIDESEDS